jgi:hypothetical protein
MGLIKEVRHTHNNSPFSGSLHSAAVWCTLTCEERDRLMDLYLAAAFQAEEAGNPKHDARVENWADVVKQAHRAWKKALQALDAHPEGARLLGFPLC